MIFDVRTYDFKPGTVPEYMAAVREVGVPVRASHGVKLVGWYYTEIGQLNQVMHIWAYDNYDDMLKKRQAFASDPRWINEYLPRVQKLLVSQRNQIMTASDFSPAPA